MSAYVVFIRNETRDADEMKQYAELAPKAPHETLELVASSKTKRYEVLEGEPAEACVIMRFPGWEDAERWYKSPEYQEARKHRLLGADTRAVLIEGIN
jgi:uncharacterized protein (DUF1330 family)